MDRLMHKSHKLRGPIEDSKPKGMRWRTYDRLWEKVNEIEETVDRYFLARCASLARSIR